MAKIPTPRSYSAVLSDMVDAFLAKFGLKQLRVGSPVLSILEAAAMSDVRSSQDIFDLLASTNLDRATGSALDRIAADENMARLPMAPSSGTVTVRDGRMTKVSTRIYQGDAAPIAGSDYVLVTDAKAFPDPSLPGVTASKCKFYIGRGTSNVEGPLTYTSKDDLGTHWRLNLASDSKTTKFHNVGESVVLAQNGNRTISAGTIAQPAQSSGSNPIQFSTLYAATIPDGEEYVENVIVVARQAGEAGNVPQNTINSFASSPFTGAQVLNPLPLSNGREAENDTDLRERIKTTRQSRSRGTALSIKNAVLGIVSPQENKRIASASVINRQGGATTLYIDDGTGYEERASGIALDALNDLALGGEQFFQLSSRAIAKASVKSVNRAPFALTTGSKLSVLVGGLLYEHTFLASEFRSISNASAYEVVASINANPDLQFIARTADGGTSVVLAAKQDTNEDLQVVVSSEGVNANAALLFPTGRADTLRLYKNDRLLSKDGQIAQIRSAPFSAWKSFSGTQDLVVAVDGTSPRNYEFTDQDFINAGTGFSRVGKNTAKAWAAVLNAVIPGITAEVNSGTITISSNAGRSAKAKIEIFSGDLIANGLFDICVSQGRANDYTLDRNLGQVRLEAPLRAGDKLSAGSLSTRAFIESSEIKTVNLQNDALMYFAIDGDAQAIRTGVGNSTQFSIQVADRNYTIAADSAVFGNVAAGDWLLLWDEALEPLNGQWRIMSKTSDSVTIRCEGVAVPAANGITLSSLGMAVVRFEGAVQKVTVPSGTNYTASALGKIIDQQLEGATCGVYRTKKLRVRTNTFDQHGSVSLVAANAAAEMIGMQVGASENYEGHLGSVESGSGAFSMPNFASYSSGDNSGEKELIDVSYFPLDYTVVGLGFGEEDYSNQAGFSSTVKEVGEDGLSIRKSAFAAWAYGDRIYAAAPFAIASGDSLIAVADGDVQTKRFSVPLWKEIKPAGTTYAVINAFKDSANSGQSLAKVFGRYYNFNDHAVLMRARVAVKHTADSSAKPDILFRYKRLGPDGEHARVRYVYPSAPDRALAVNVTDLPDSVAGMTDIDVVLPSGAAVNPSALTNSAVLGYDYAKQNDLYKVNVRAGFTAASASATGGVVTVKVSLPAGVSAHGLTGTVYLVSTNPAISSGTKTITQTTNDSFSFAQTGASFAEIPLPGKVLAGQVPGASFEGVTVGALVNFDSASSAPAYLKGKTAMVAAVATDLLSIQVQTELSVAQNSVTTPVWQLVSDASKFMVFALNNSACTANAVANSINALDDACPVTATVLKGTGALAVTGSSSDMAGAPGVWHELKDGVNWVKETVQPATDQGDYQFVFKKVVTPGLVDDAGWQSETARIVPITLDAIRNWLSVPAISGLFSACSIETSASGSKLQLSTLTAGSGGSIQIQGGGANEVRAPVVGSASAKNGYAVCDIRASDAVSMQAGQWVAINNAKAQPKTSPTSIASITASGQVNLSSSPQTVITETKTVRFEKQGSFVAVIGVTAASTSEGGWIKIDSATASAANKGTFRVVRASDSVAWIENATAVEESAQCNLAYITASSLMVGDVVSFNTDALTTAGKWAISEVGSNYFRLQLASGQSLRPLTSVASVPSGSITITEGAPARLIKRIHSIAPSPRSSAWASVKFDTDACHSSIASGAGSVITVLNKLGFPNTTSYGIDGYAYSLGLISEANRVVYGDPSDTSTYPGMAAAGSTINISGPIVKRATVSLSIRTRLGVSTSDVSDKVKGAVATAISRSAIGQAIAISDVVKAASRVSGVQAVSILEPTYGAGNDLIPVQPYEKLLVLDVDQDIVVTFVGE